MPKWTDYTTKTTVADNDEVMVLDTAGKANKRLSLSTLSDWVLGKIADKVFEKLQTNDKTILGAINELNSNLPGIEFLTRTITAESEKKAYDLQINATEYMIISIQAENRVGWQYTVTRGVSGIEATQNWAICFIGNPTGNFTFKVAVLKIK